jgi:3-phenylpropionate/trans-cinnamate dioxygenase ferredoxin subunit
MANLPALPFDNLRPGEITPAFVNGRPVAFYLVDEHVYCTEDICTHESCAISNGGFVEGTEVECPCHGARFDVRTGAVTAPPAVDRLSTFPVEVRDGQIYVAL